MKRQIIFLTVVLALLYLAGCITASSAKIGDLSVESAETGQNLPTEETMEHRGYIPVDVTDDGRTIWQWAADVDPTIANVEINDISPKQVPKWAFIGKISKEHPTLFKVLTLHTNDMVKSLAIINKNSSKYSEKYLRFLPDGTSVYISKDNELFINKKGGPAPEEVATANKKPDNNNEISRPEYKPVEKQIITAPAEAADKGQK